MKYAILLATAAMLSSVTANAQSVSKADKKFVDKAAMGGMAEVATGQLAAQQASNDQVKQFGQMMVTDHGKANDQLKQIASAKNIAIPASDPKSDKEMAKLQGKTGPAFDKAYVKTEVKDHAATIKLFQKEADNGSAPDLKKFASDTLPTLQMHADKAGQLASAMGK
jgi:putative membrane protein